MRKVVVLIGIALLTVGVVGADLGTMTVSMGVTTTPGTYDVDIALTVSTTGAVSPASNDVFMHYGQLYYPSVWDTTAPSFTFTGASDWPYWRDTTVPNHFFATTYSLTAPVEIPGAWGIWGWGAGWNTATGATNGTGYIVFSPSETQWMATTLPAVVQPTPTFNPGGEGGEPIPTLNWLGMMAMIAMMLGVAVLVIIRRR